ncbi:UNVERIFIED_CONTAM: hypothetical protein Sradi_2227300 [Sesamum radiatum]|uniref:Uncharacterized protein n=1 Tax=Sesamum radiatum TaxID=300843 RepID=A0AAW2T1Z7_SESRA
MSSLTSSITTLEDCLMMNSPALEPQCIVGSGENIHQVLKQTGKRVYPSSPDVDGRMFYTPRMSFSCGKVEKMDEVCMSSKQVMKKKVRFKLPEEADIIIFYSPRETFDDHDDS